MKAAGHEMKGLEAILHWELMTVGLDAMRWPLMALIDHCGYRLLASSILPINRDTLALGSMDGGNHVQWNPSVLRFSYRMGEWLGLRKHTISRCSRNTDTVSVCTPVDFEIHMVNDMLYCLDLARLMPPRTPKSHGDHIIRLFRPEFLKCYEIPLCANAFTPCISRHTSSDNAERIKIEKEIFTATCFLEESAVLDVC